MSRTLFPAAVLLAVVGIASAFPIPKKSTPEKLVTRTYDLAPVLGGKLSGREKTDSETVVRLILETVRIGDLVSSGDGPQIVERDGGKLEVRASQRVQEDIKDLLDALTRLADLAVDVKTDLVEFDRAAFEKDVRPLLKPAPGKTDLPAVVPFGQDGEEPAAKGRPPVETLDRVVKNGKIVQSSAGRYANGAESLVSARQAVFTFPGRPTQSGKEGYRLNSLLVVSGDRRFVRLRLTEQSAAVIGTRKRTLGEVGGKPIVATAPEVSEFGKTATVEIPDGGAVLFRLDYAPKDRVWVVVLRPTIFIQAEEDARKKQEKEVGPAKSPSP